ncbi:MAG: metal-sulfur cluster assembly factor [Candidatus Roizmanbacteria bacterium]|nr:metal-sulfur cluster assembly factor [Candidatus Roizmanbacteria bacterium]MCR4313403.1 metal-sulfur cluster assembly factor [Candidatus Roizmanbacteria bacterium]
MKITQKAIINKLIEVMDPELNISIVDLGLVYDTQITKNKVKIIMTLTTIGCPLFSLIETQVRDKIKELGVKDEDISLDLTFDPPWSMEKMSKKGKAMLGI